MRLIDADALLENYNLKDATKYGNRDAEQQYHSYSTMMLYEIADMIEDAPTVEAVPVVRGEWEVVKGIFTPGGDPLLRCPKCKSRESEHMGGVEFPQNWNFCPNCGADMRGK